MMIREKYQNRANREARYKELVEQYGKDRVSRRTARNQQLHPEYINDWDGPLETGFGNKQYRTVFKAIYILEVRHDH